MRRVRELGRARSRRRRRPPMNCATRSTSSATSCAFDGPHAAGPVARESASVSAASSRKRRRPTRRARRRAAIVAGSSRSRRIATSDSSRWLPTSSASTSMSASGKPEARRRAGARSRRRRRCDRRRVPLPRSCSSALITRRSGRSTRSAQPAALAVVSSRCRSTVKRWYALCCGRERTGSHSGRIRAQMPR